MFHFDLINFLVENILIDIPFSLTFVLFGLIICGFRDKIHKNQLILFTLTQALIDTSMTIFTHKAGMQTIPYLIFSLIFIWFIFKIDIISSIIIIALSTISILLYQTLFFEGFGALFGITNIINAIEKNITLKILLSETMYSLLILTILFMYKKNIYLINLRKFKLFAQLNKETNHDINEDTKVTAIILIPMVIFVVMNFSIHYYQDYNNIQVSSSIYFLINSFATAISSILMFFLIRRIINLRNYKIEWKSQQNYLNDVNELLKRLRAQKHGFLNHMNIINGLIALKEYENAKEYIESIHETISLKNNAISLDNPTLSAMLNAKSKAAENKNIDFSINLDDSLTSMNFKSFEIGEAIGNIIDNAIEATCEQGCDKRKINIKIYSDNFDYIFDIQNTGNTIPQTIISKLFDEGFSTKDYENGDHGFGLYISKNIIEYHRGKIEVESKDNITLFKIYLPKVINNEYKAS